MISQEQQPCDRANAPRVSKTSKDRGTSAPLFSSYIWENTCKRTYWFTGSLSRLSPLAIERRGGIVNCRSCPSNERELSAVTRVEETFRRGGSARRGWSLRGTTDTCEPRSSSPNRRPTYRDRDLLIRMLRLLRTFRYLLSWWFSDDVSTISPS